MTIPRHPYTRLTRRAAMMCALACTLSLFPHPLRAETERLTIFAAASLKGALDEALSHWPGGRVVVSYGGSAAQARQVALGAPADLVILAHPEWMAWLAGQGVLRDAAPRAIAANRLVVIAPRGSARPLEPSEMREMLGATGRLAMGARRAVPAGQYAQQWLQAADLWSDLAPRLAETENVRAALALVALGEAPLGIVYATDAQAEPKVAVVFEVPPGLHDPIIYPAAITRDASAHADAMLKWLSGPEAQAVLTRHGFDVSGATP